MMMRSLSPLVPRFPTSPVPSISIDFAPVEEVIPEPPSPFAASSRRSDDDESLRSNHLLPPPAISPRARHMYHMQQQQAQQQSQQAQQQQRQRQQGVDPARFESMLQFARSERPAASKQQLELRKEVAFKAHQSRQAERRRLFLSKIVALPSPTATATPVTPPESPAVFHFTLPSPGLVSPLALFETLDYDPTNADVRIEHVDFRARAKRDADAMAAITRNVKQSMEINGLSYPSSGRRQQRQPLSPALPSLAQISARLNATSNVTTNRAPVTNGSRLPAFLRKTDAASAPVSPPSPAVVVVPPPTTTTTTAAAATRLPAFLRSRDQKKSPTSSSGSSDTIRPTPTPRSPAPPALSITPPDAPLPSPTTPSIAIFSPTSPPSMSLPSDDAVLLDERARHAKDMVDKLRRRVSAPAELTSRKDTHPILKVHGGF